MRFRKSSHLLVDVKNIIGIDIDVLSLNFI